MAKQNIVIVTDFNLSGSGYQTIMEGIALELCSVYDVTILGLKYDASEHYYPFRLITTHYQWLPEHIISIVKALKADWLIVALDVPKICAILNAVHNRKFDLKTIKVAGIFPVEASPLDDMWAANLLRFTDVRFTFTNFGMRVLSDAKVSCNKISAGVDHFWYAKDSVPKLVEHANFVLTVADNQVRKNLPAGLEIFARYLNVHPESDLYYVLVTSIASKDGWAFDSGKICERLGLDRSRVIYIDSNLPKESLRGLYRHAACLLQTSLAEGIGLPVYEAQACGCPVLVTKDTGAAEAILLGDVIEYDKTFIYPWGNVDWRFVSIDDGVKKLEIVLNIVHRSIPFPSWRDAANRVMIGLSITEKIRHDFAERVNEKESSIEIIGNDASDSGQNTG